MSRNSEISMTYAGRKLIMRAIVESKALVFTSAQAGTGVLGDSADIHSVEALINPLLRGASFGTRRIDSNGNVIIQVELSNASFLERTNIYEIGIYAKLEGDATPVLFSYMTFGSSPDVVPAASTTTVVRIYHQIFNLGSGTNVSVEYKSEDLPEYLYYMDYDDSGVVEVDE